MLKLMIVDDEPAELECLAKMISWDEYGYELCYALDNSAKAHEILSSEHIDVLISDISMPHPDGLDLAQFIYENKSYITVVLISAYADFKYAQQALSYHVFSYITKPFSYEQITTVLSQIQETHIVDNNPNDLISLIFVQQAIIDYCSDKIFAHELEKIYAEYFPASNITKSPVMLLSVNINNLTQYLQNTWDYGLDRLYVCIIRYLNSTLVNFVPINFVFGEMLLLAFPTRTSCSAEALKTACTQAISSFYSSPAKELKIDIEISMLSSHSNLNSAKATLNNHISFPSNSIENNSENCYDIIKSALTYISKNYAKPISIADVSHAVGVSPYHFSRLFKQETNETVANHIISVRLKTAAKLLLATDKNISDIAREVGYNSIPHFHKAFKSIYGLTPRDYRLHQHKKEEQ